MSKLPLPFPLGKIVLTEGAFAALQSTGQTPEQVLVRHCFGDWGELNDEDWERNDHALLNALRLLSSYPLRDKTTVWVITEWDRSTTTVLLPSEY